MVNHQIYKHQNFELLPHLAVTSCIRPGFILQGAAIAPEFPKWMGKRSTETKNRRLLAELQVGRPPCVLFLLIIWVLMADDAAAYAHVHLF